MELRYRDEVAKAKSNSKVLERREYIKKAASRYFRLQHGKSHLIEKQKNKDSDVVALQLWKNQKKLSTHEKILLANVKNKADFYALLEGIHDAYSKAEAKFKKAELTNHILCSIIMFQIFLNGIIMYCKELSEKAILFLGGAGIFTVFMGMSSFVKSISKNKEYKLLQNTYNKTIEKLAELFKESGFIR